MKKYHVAAGDGKGYYGVGYESYRQAESLLKISQEHDPQAHIVEEEYPFTNADRIRAMSDEELAEFLCGVFDDDYGGTSGKFIFGTLIEEYDEDSIAEWLKQPVEA